MIVSQGIIIPTSGLAVVIPSRKQMPVLKQLPVVPPEPGEAIVAVEACGICGSDHLLIAGGFGNVFPVVPGHEAAGTVIAVGSADDSRWLGKRVALYYIHDRSGRALPNRPNLGIGLERMGVDVNGALAQYITRPIKTLVNAEGFSAVEAAILTDAMSTPYHAVQLANLTAGQTVAVIGVGGIGSGAIQFAKARGAEVLAIGRSFRSSELALNLGASRYLMSSTPSSKLSSALGRPLDVVIQCVGNPKLDKLAIKIVGIGGKVVLVGASDKSFQLASTDLIWKGLTLVGSRGFTPSDISAVMAEYRAGRVRIDHLTESRIELTQAPETLTSKAARTSLRTVVTIHMNNFESQVGRQS